MSSNPNSQGATGPGATESTQREKTFRAFTQSQSTNYAQFRRDYHPRLYNLLLSHHQSTGGLLTTLLDVGCGPGTAVRTLASHFNHAIGIDPSEGMIATARKLGGVTGTGEEIRFVVGAVDGDGVDSGEEVIEGVPDGSVDLIVSATAAHWFDMARFWPRAARLLRPGGTVALWCSGGMLVDPSRVPNGEAIQATIDRVETDVDEYLLPGNRLARGLYADLVLPWMLETPVEEFNGESFVRKEWGVGEGNEPIDEFYNTDKSPVGVGMLVAVLGTTSPVVRWREANPDKVGTASDPLKVMRAEIERLLQEAGEEPGAAVITGGVAGVLLMIKKKAS
jgi:SAM-dependent methyltransferase